MHAGAIFAGWANRIGAPAQALLAAKTALAASIAWMVAPYMPFMDDRYSYYAPLGAVISMYPTVLGSVRSGAQKLLGLAVGVLLAFGALAIGGQSVVAVALVVGVGVCVAGLRILGEGRSWVPVTALLVLLIGGSNADNYSWNRLIHVVLGFVIGMIVNALVVPPLFLRDATAKLNRLRGMVAEGLRNLADALNDNGKSERDWSRLVARLEDTAQQVQQAVYQANESRKGNPRGQHAGDQVSDHYQRLRALEHTIFFVHDLIDVVGGFAADDDHGSAAPDEARAPLVAATVAVADLVDCDIRTDRFADCVAEADNAIEQLQQQLEDRTDGHPGIAASDVVTASVYLRRIVDASRPLSGTQ